MNMNTIRASAACVFGLALLAIPAAAQQPTKIYFSDETVGAEPKAVVAVVGIWRIESEGGKNVLAVDGTSRATCDPCLNCIDFPRPKADH